MRSALSPFLFLLAACVVGGLSLQSAAAADPPRTIVAERVQLSNGRLVEGRAVVLDAEGRIERLAAADDADLPEPRLDCGPGSVLVPGFHEFLSSVGAPGELVETVEPFDVDANARAVIDPGRRDLEAARRAGVLHATVAPAERNPLNGRAITIHTGARPTLAEVVATRATGGGPLVFAVGETALSAAREPTSRAGLRIAIEEWLAGAGRGHLEADARKSVAPPLVHCTEAMDVRTALDLFGALAPTLVLASGGTEAAALLARSGPEGAFVVVGPYDARTPIPELRGAVALARGGAELVFRGGMPRLGAESLRESARRAVSQGLDPAAARRAMTANPARVAGLGGSIGAIVQGARADLVVLDGDPLLPASRVLTVIEGGRVLTDAAPPTLDRIPPIEESTEVPR